MGTVLLALLCALVCGGLSVFLINLSDENGISGGAGALCFVFGFMAIMGTVCSVLFALASLADALRL